MAAAPPSRPAPRQNLDGVMIDISSRRPRRVHVRHLAPDRPRSPRSRSRLEMKDEWAAAALPVRPTPRQNLDGVMIDISSRRPHRVHVRHLARDRPRSPEIAISPRDEGRVGGGGAASAPHASPESRRRDDRHQIAQATSSPCPSTRSRSSEIAMIAISWHAAYALSGGRKCPTSGGHSKPSTHPPQPSSWLGRKELQVAQPTGASASPWPEACCGTLPEIAISPRDEGE